MRRLLWSLEFLEILAMIAGMAAFEFSVCLGFGLVLRVLVAPSLPIWWVIAVAAIMATLRPLLLPDLEDVVKEKASAIVFLFALPFLAPSMLFHCLLKWCERRRWPRSLRAAIDQIVAELDAESLRDLREMPQENLCELHFGLGLWIRNGFGLWQGNRELLAECETDDADTASGIILLRLWEHVRAGGRA